MADNNDPWKRFRERVIDRSGGPKISLAQRRKGVTDAEVQLNEEGQEISPSEEADRAMEAAGGLMEQLAHLYNMYLSGVERRPPVERRKLLERKKHELMSMTKPTASIRFRVNALCNQIQMNLDRWDKQMRALESGRIKRRQGEKPNRGGSGGSSSSGGDPAI